MLRAAVIASATNAEDIDNAHTSSFSYASRSDTSLEVEYWSVSSSFSGNPPAAVAGVLEAVAGEVAAVAGMVEAVAWGVVAIKACSYIKISLDWRVCVRIVLM